MSITGFGIQETERGIKVFATRIQVYARNVRKSLAIIAIICTLISAGCNLSGSPAALVTPAQSNPSPSDTSDTSDNRGADTVAIEPNGDVDDDNIMDELDVDDDGDGLIEIHDLVMLNAIRYALDGTHYDDEADDGEGNEGNSTGCPSDGCIGYELTRNLDFADEGSYPDGIVKSEWRPNQGNLGQGDNAGWEPIGGNGASFSATFEGNGYTISNLYMRVSTTASGRINSGFFNALSSRGAIRNVELTDANVYGKSGAGNVAGILVGQNTGAIISTYVTGNIYGQNASDVIGGLVGENDGTIVDGKANVNVYGGGNSDYVGGLVGDNLNEIVASFSKGVIRGGDGDDYIGGLSGSSDGSIVGSYSHAAVHGEGGNDRVGGLLGANGGYISGTYATGNSDGGDSEASDDNSIVGGLVAENYGTIIASYATGNASNGMHIGALVGDNGRDPNSGIQDSYAFGTPNTATGRGSTGTALPTGVSDVTDLSGNPDDDEYAGARWNSADSNTHNVWDFRSAEQAPVLRYADYDGATGRVYRCVEDSTTAYYIIPNCGMVLAGQ